MNPDKLMTIPEVARAVGKSRRVVLRHLHAANRAVVAAGGESILVAVPGSGSTGRAFRVSVRSLRVHYPLWLTSSDDLPDALREANERIDDLAKSVRQRFGSTGARIRGLEKFVGMRKD